MNADIENLVSILHAGQAIWTICAGAFLCILIDSVWPKKMATAIYAVALVTLGVALVMTVNQGLSLVPCTRGLDPADLKDLASCVLKADAAVCAECVPLVSQNLLTVDLMTVAFMGLVILIAMITLLNALGYLKLHQNLTGEFSALILFSVIGMIFLFASDHLIVNFIGLETMSLAIYVLVGSHKKNIKSNEAALKYFILGGVASAVLLYGIALFYGAFGSLRLSEMLEVFMSLKKSGTPGLAYLPKLGLGLILAGLLFKLAIVPFHFWAPDIYEGAPAPVTGFMATGVKVAVFGLAIRVFMSLNALSLKETFDMAGVQSFLTIAVAATFIVGNLVAIVQEDVKRMLAYSSISHAGFLLFGILAGFKGHAYDVVHADVVFFYLFGYLFMTLGAFAVLSLMVQEKNEATNFGDLRGLGYKHPILAGVFGLFMLAMMGLPGTVGFAAKYGIVALAVQNGHIAMAVLAVTVSVISAFYYLRPIAVMFFKDDAARSVIKEMPLTLCITITTCVVAVLYLGFMPDKYLKLSCLATSVFHKSLPPTCLPEF